MSVTDIRPLKAELRRKYREIRTGLSPENKQEMDRQVLRRVRNLWQYRENDILLTYVSTAIEVDTRALIEAALADGKRVAVPRCVPGTRNMEFYFIGGIDELEPGTFGVLEPVIGKHEKMTDFSHGLCIVPALCYDWAGFRLGYGGGYYDRFLSGFGGCMIGIGYSSCVRRVLPHGRFDRPVELIVTEKYLRKTARREGRNRHG